MTYGGTVPAVTPSYSGFVQSEGPSNLTTPPTCTTTATSTSPVGTYPTTCSGAASSNYAISYSAGSLTVTRAPLTITASSATVILGGGVPAITPIYAGFVAGDGPSSLTTQPTCSTTATSASPMGTYPSTCSGAASPNYSIQYASGLVKIAMGINGLFNEKASNSGSTIPIKVQLVNAGGTNLSSSTITVSLVTPAVSPNPGTAPQPTGTFTFMATGDSGPMYQYNLKATGYPSGTYTLGFTVTGDPVTHTVQFIIR